MKNSANLYEPSWVQLAIPGLFEQLENFSEIHSKEKSKIHPQTEVWGYTNKVRLRGLKTK